jgi:hypothetical protein
MPALTFWMLFVTFLLPASTCHTPRLRPVAEYSLPSLAIHVLSRLRTPIGSVITVLLRMLIVVILWAGEIIPRAHRIVALVLPLEGFHHALI